MIACGPVIMLGLQPDNLQATMQSGQRDINPARQQAIETACHLEITYTTCLASMME
jgi:hypothetical protein